MTLGRLLGGSTRKAQVSAIATAVATVLASVLPNVDGTAATIILVVLSVLGAYGITYATPNNGSANVRDTDR